MLFGKLQLCSDVFFFSFLWRAVAYSVLSFHGHHDLCMVHSLTEMLSSSNNSFKPLAVTLRFFFFFNLTEHLPCAFGIPLASRESGHSTKWSPFIDNLI